MTLKKLGYRLEAVAARALYTVLGAVPVDAASALAGGLTRLIGPRLGVSRVARRNLARAFPEKSDAEIESIVAEAWENLGRVAGEFPHLGELVHGRVEVAGIEHLHAVRDDGLPALFVSAHCGNWELPGTVAYNEGLPVTLVYRAANNPWIEDLFRRGRGPAAAGGQIAKGADGARQIMKALKAGAHIGMLVDQKMNDGIAVPFFGRDAMTAPAVGRFAAKFACPVVPLRVERLRGAHFRVTFYPPMDHAPSGDPQADTLDLMTRINAMIESWIRERPGQWLWMHRRWPD